MKSILLVTFSLMVSLSFAQLTPKEAFENMGRGINMGNTLEAPTEGEWAPKAQEYFFDDYKATGFTTVRIPVRWYPYTDTIPPYKVSTTWMDRVETVVDWALSKGFFVIINCHHSKPIKEEYEVKKAQWDSIWVQVSDRFQHKSEKLFFEMMNEPHGWTVDQTNEFNIRTLGIIRKKNPTRIVIYSGNGWSASNDLTNPSLQIPDINDNYLMGTYHSYNPWSFGGEGLGTWGTQADKNAVANTFSSVASWSETKNIPVLLGEFGSTYVCNDGGESDLNSRFRHYACYVENAIKNNIRFTVWDDNGWFQVYNRGSRSWKEWKDILIHYSPESVTDFSATIEDDSTVTLKWKNQAIDYDSVTLERKRVGLADYETIGKVESGVFQFKDSSLTIGYEYYYRAITHQADTVASWGYPQKILTKVAIQSPFKGYPHQVPGTIEGEEFDNGIQDLSYHDTSLGNEGNAFRLDVDVDIEKRNDGGFQVGWIESSEWIEYTIDIAKTSDYIISTHAASLEGGGKFQMKFERGRTRTWEVPATGGWQTNVVLTGSKLRLPAGEQVMRIEVIEGDFNIDKFVFVDSKATNIETVNANSVQFYPNPSDGNFSIQSPDFAFKKMTVVNLSGKTIFERNFAVPANKSTLIQTNLNEGFYFLNLINDGKIISKKIIVKK